MDNSIPGHTLLEPFIAVCGGFSRIVSPLPIERSSRLLEVIQRIVLGIVLPLIGVLSLAFVPLGLLIKGSVTLCCPLPQRIPLQRIEVTPPPTPEETFSQPSEPGVPFADEAVVLIDIRTLLVEASTREIDLSKISEAESLLDTLDSAGKEDLRTWIQILKNRVPVGNQASNASPPSPRDLELSHVMITDSGEASVAPDGDCLFTSFRFQSKMHGSENLGSGDERTDTVEWIRTYYLVDKELKFRLINSLFEHYQSRIDRKREEMPTKQDDETISEELARMALETTIVEEIQTLMIEKMGPINRAIAVDYEKFKIIQHLVPSYLDEMAQPRVFGGSAELYALSYRHKVCVIIHPKKGDKIGSPNKEKINPQFETLERPARHFTKTHNHYNPLFPKKELLPVDD